MSTLIDVVRKRHAPTPFGTQHIALVLAAWGPVIVFCEFYILGAISYGTWSEEFLSTFTWDSPKAHFLARVEDENLVKFVNCAMEQYYYNI